MKTKLSITLMIVLLIQTIINGQESNQLNRNPLSVGITYSNFGDAIVHYDGGVDGAGSTSVDHFSGFGVVCTYSVKKWLELETGVIFTKYYLTSRSAPTPEVYVSKHHASIFSFPIVARLNFLKYFFFNGGIMVEYDSKLNPVIHDQSGIAATAGIGVKYEFNSGLSIYLNPYMTEHALVPFMGDDYRNQVYESAIRFGITYRIK